MSEDLNPEHEAPAAVKLRQEASENLGIIEDLRAHATEHGDLSTEDEKVLKEWQEEDVAKKLDDAEEKNRKRQEFLAGHAATNALVHDSRGNFLTPKEVQEAQSGNSAIKK